MKRVTILILIFLIYFVTPIEAKEYFIKQIDVKGVSLIDKKEVMDLFDVKAPGVVTLERIDLGIKRLFKKGIFKNIKVDVAENGILIIYLEQKRFVRSIKIKGNRYFSDETIESKIHIKEDAPFNPVELKSDENRLQRYLRTRGFPELEVETSVKERKDGWVDVFFYIKEGKPLRIKSILIKGYPQIIKAEMHLDPGDIYDIEVVKDELDFLKEYFKKKGYINPTVGPFSFYKGQLTIYINPGKKLILKFDGNRVFSDSELEKLSELRQMQKIDRDSIDLVTDKIIEAYKKRGYLDIQVAPVVTEQDETMMISFFIFEGKRYKVSKISFEGISFDEDLFKEIMNLQEDTVYDPYKLNSDLDRILAYYRSLGYLEAKIKEADIKTNKKDNSVDIRIVVDEGLRYKVSEINIQGNRFFKRERILRYIRPHIGENFNETELLNSKFKLLDEYKREGFLDAKVAVKSQFEDGKVKIYVKIKEGKRFRVGKIIVRGNTRTKTEVILREIQLTENDPLDFRVLSESSRKLYRLGLFKDIKISTTNAYDNKKDILIEVKERPHGVFEFGFGYGEYEGFRAMFNWSYNNISGMNRRVNIRLEGSNLKKRFFINYHEPYFGRSDTSFNAVFQYIEKERIDVESNDTLYKVKKYSSEVSLERQIFQDTKGFIAYNYSLVKTYEVKPDVVLSKEDRGTLGISSIRPGFLYDSRDHPFDPRHGMVFGASLKLASRFLLSETDFYKLTVSSSFYYPVSKRVTAALALRGGFAEGFGDTKELPIVERFFLGGRNSVRGFAQDSLGPKGDDNSPTGGNAFLMGSIELRIDVGKGIGFVVFVDTGNVWERLKDIDFSTRKTAGVGIRIRTPVGPVRFDYGHKLDRKDGESSGELHFSIGHAF